MNFQENKDNLVQFVRETLEIAYHYEETNDGYEYIKTHGKPNAIVFLFPINSMYYSRKEKVKILMNLRTNDKIILYGDNYDSNKNLFKKTKLYEAELLGFFYFLGFELLNSKVTVKRKFFYFKKKTTHNNSIKKYPNSPIIKLRRIGEKGKIINIYKIRTMHPYSEYLQSFMIENNKYSSTGKINNDFRITRSGKFLRKYYLDELPQIINLLKGDIRLVGCRPVSDIFLKNYPNDIYNQRIKNKPGIITPAVADKARTIEDVISSERNYLDRRSTNPLKTDLVIFFKALKNYLFGNYAR